MRKTCHCDNTRQWAPKQLVLVLCKRSGSVASSCLPCLLTHQNYLAISGSCTTAMSGLLQHNIHLEQALESDYTRGDLPYQYMSFQHRLPQLSADSSWLLYFTTSCERTFSISTFLQERKNMTAGKLIGDKSLRVTDRFTQRQG